MTRNIVLSGLLMVILGGVLHGQQTEVPSSSPDSPNLMEKALQEMGDAEEIVFAVRGLYAAVQPNANFGRWADAPIYAHSPDGSKLCKLNMRTGKVTVLLNDPQGGVRDPRVHYDGDKILFSYRKGGTHHYHLCEINTDGTGFKQLTFGEYDDIDPAYLPDGGIVFVSTRGKRFVPCQQFRAGLLFRMDSDGSNMLCLSANNVFDDRPAVVPSGQIIYSRWEYVDRHEQKFRDLWLMNPDGTAQVLFFGPVRPEGQFFAKCDALPIPGTNRVVSILSPALGRRENAGNVAIIDPKAGPEEWSSAKTISKLNLAWNLGYGREGFRDPYPLSETCFLVAQNKSLLVLDDKGNTHPFYQAEEMVHDPRVIRSRPREPVIPSRIDLQKTTGHLILSDVYIGRNMKGVKRGDIKKILVLEDLPKPVSYRNDGIADDLATAGTLTLRRVLGTAPVEPDGSASFEVPALRGIYFVALDEKGLAVKRMQSFTMVMPGETQSCVGCHEERTTGVTSIGDNTLMALNRPPSKLEPVSGVPEVIDYPRDVQPIWDRHCVSCHSAEEPSGRVILTGDKSEFYSQSYLALVPCKRVSILRNKGKIDGNNPPWGFGSSASLLMKLIDDGHYDVKLTEEERNMVRLWIDSSAVFVGTYAIKYYPKNAVTKSCDNPWRKVYTASLGNPVASIVEKRCLTCHNPLDASGKSSGKREVNMTECYHTLYNLSYPEKSVILLAPLSKEAGGYQWCKSKNGKPDAVFANTQDPDYQVLLGAIQAAKARIEKNGRIDLPNATPNEHYIYNMKLFGILHADFDISKDSIDPYETDRAYWRSLWHHPPVPEAESISKEIPGTEK